MKNCPSVAYNPFCHASLELTSHLGASSLLNAPPALGADHASAPHSPQLTNTRGWAGGDRAAPAHDRCYQEIPCSP